MKKLSWLIGFGLWLSFSAMGQNESQTNSQIWVEALVDNAFGAKWDMWVDGSYRKINTEDFNYWRATIRPNIKWKALPRLDVRAGIGGFYTDYEEDDKTLEIRPWEGIALSWPKLKRLRFVHLVRFEQRFVYEMTNWTYDYSNRLRYQLSTRFSFDRKKKYKVFFIPAAIEFFYQERQNANELFQDRIWFTTGLGYIYNREVTVDVKFVVERNRSDDFEFNTTDFIVRLRFRYNLFSFKEDETKL